VSQPHIEHWEDSKRVKCFFWGRKVGPHSNGKQMEIMALVKWGNYSRMLKTQVDRKKAWRKLVRVTKPVHEGGANCL